MLREIVEGMGDAVKKASEFFRQMGIYGENLDVTKSKSGYIEGYIEFSSNTEAKETEAIIYAKDEDGVVDDFEIKKNVLKFTLSTENM